MRNKTCPYQGAKNKSHFLSKNNLESMRGSSNPQGDKSEIHQKRERERKKKTLNFINLNNTDHPRGYNIFNY